MTKVIGLQQENIQHLLQLIKDNPELEIMPMVDTEVVPCDDFGCWMGSWGKASVDEYWTNDDRIYFRSEDEDNLVEREADVIYDQYDKSLPYEELEKIAKANIDKHDWQKIIVVRIKAV